MGLGAIWQSFEITQEEYYELKDAVLSVIPKELKNFARYSNIQFEFDSEFDSIQDWMEWVVAVCDKRRENYHQKI